MADDDEDLRSVALQNATAILATRQRSEAELLRAKRELEEETRVLEILNRTATLLASTLDLQGVLQAVTDASTQVSGAAFGAFFYVAKDEQGGSFMLYTLSGAPREAFERFGHPRATPLFGPTFAGERVVRIDDVLADPRYGRWGPHHGMPPGHLPVRSYLAVPVVLRAGETIGGLFFGHPEVGVFTERAERIVVGMAAQASVAIENARLFESERAARAQAERNSELKDQFLATLSHELRTPMNAIVGWAALLLRDDVEPELRRRGMEAIARNAGLQTQLIEDLLDMSRITSGKTRLDLRSVWPIECVEAALESVRPSADAKGVALEAALDASAGPVRGDPTRLQQIAWNLLSNAVKFTSRGGAVRIALARAGSHVELVVSDDGVGMTREFLPHAFERFRQADGSSTRAHGGLGLGLAIVKSLVELHGGTVHAASEGPGRGATFTVLLPVAAVRGLDRAPPEAGGEIAPWAVAHAELDATELAGVRVLVVDDDHDARDLVDRVLRLAGASVETARSGAEALVAIEREPPDVLLSDIGMPEMDGYELVRQVRARDARRPLPAIAITAFARPEDRTRALRAGFSAHMSKPVDPGELVATVASVARLVLHGA